MILDIQNETLDKTNSLIERIKSEHFKAYGVSNAVVAVAPARFHLLGEHTWYFGGKTLSMAINRYVCVSVSKRSDDLLRFTYIENGECKKINLSALRFRKEDKWANSIKAIIHGLVSTKIIEKIEDIPGMDFCVSSEIQPSAGLGITTAMKVCAAFSINKLLELECSDSEILSVIEKGGAEFLKEKDENHFAENLTAMFSEENSVVLTDHSKSIPYTKSAFSTSSFSTAKFLFNDKIILLIDAKVPRFSVWNETYIMKEEYRKSLDSVRVYRSGILGGWNYDEGRGAVTDAIGEVPEDIRRHLQGIVSEHKCAMEAYNALLNNDYSSFAKAINTSHENMRDLYDISCPEIDWILKRLVEINPNPDNDHNPVCCGRITGQGFARCLYAILDKENIPEFMERLSDYTKIFGFKTSYYEVKPSAGVFVRDI